MLNVCCVWENERRGAEYVNILFDMVRRNLPQGMEGRFVCFTDLPGELHPEIERRRLPPTIFEPGLFPDGDKIFYMELETCVVGPLDKLVSQDGPTYCGEGMWPLCAAIWPANNAKKSAFKTWGSVLPNAVATYDEDGHARETRIVTFDPELPPHLCEGWVQDVWKIGGGTAAELVFEMNVSLDTMLGNIRSACRRKPARWVDFADSHDGVACIVAGGPSLAQHWPFVQALQHNGANIFAINNVPRFLAERGVVPNSHVLLDALIDCADYVAPHLKMQRFYASQCHPTVLDMAGEDLILWHPAVVGLEDAIPEIQHPFIGGGTTCATRAIGLAFALGYRKLHIFGMDCSYFGDASHAYDQSPQDSVLDVTFAGQTFKVPPQLLGQAEDFKNMVPDLLAQRCEITVHGYGLIPAIAREMAKQH